MKRDLLVLLMVFAVLIAAGCETPKRTQAELMDQAWQEHWGRDWEGVIRLTTEAIELDPDKPWPYSMRGAAHNALGKYDIALKDLNRAIEISPDYAPAYTNKAITFMRMDDNTMARLNIDEALYLDRTNLTVLMTAAEVYTVSGSMGTACGLLFEAVGLGFRDFEVIEERGSFSMLYASPCYEEARARAGLGP